ncbi:hypothetical protein QBC46DRAFT_353124 [Diplogelasinospora grovesii]|uniref:Uncharacterized protein n=1 Tax=Diplogelasinospora grovesii TaxID=303347 RepID=A0AAN6NBE3_9PEZI|nr:hypothetical protein QBC46DRAFT_353124 [Diplogelasinospora grovesii]
MSSGYPLTIAGNFSLERVIVNGRSSGYKDPHLVLKTQHFESNAPSTGSNMTGLGSRCLLLVYVKDQADELVALDLSLFPASSVGGGPTRGYKFKLSEPKASVSFSYPKDGVPHIVELIFRDRSEYEVFLCHAELRASGVVLQPTRPSSRSGITTSRSSPVGALTANSSPMLDRRAHSGSPLMAGNPGAVQGAFYKVSRLGPGPPSAPVMMNLSTLQEPQSFLQEPMSSRRRQSLEQIGADPLSRKRRFPDSNPTQERDDLASNSSGGSSKTSRHSTSGLKIARRGAPIANGGPVPHTPIHQDGASPPGRQFNWRSGPERQTSSQHRLLPIIEAGIHLTDATQPAAVSPVSLQGVTDMGIARPLPEEARAQRRKQVRFQKSRGLETTPLDGDIPHISHGDASPIGHDTSESDCEMLLKISELQQYGLSEATRIFHELLDRSHEENDSVEDDGQWFENATKIAEEYGRRITDLSTDTTGRQLEVQAGRADPGPSRGEW